MRWIFLGVKGFERVVTGKDVFKCFKNLDRTTPCGASTGQKGREHFSLFADSGVGANDEEG